jgi:hypothetical protein
MTGVHQIGEIYEIITARNIGVAEHKPRHARPPQPFQTPLSGASHSAKQRPSHLATVISAEVVTGSSALGGIG